MCLSSSRCLCPPDPRSQLTGLPGVPPGQRGAQLPPHAAAGDQSPDRPLPGFAGGLREGRLQDEQLVHRHRPAAGEEAGGEHRRTLQVGQEARIFVHNFPINTPIHTQNERKSSMFLDGRKLTYTLSKSLSSKRQAAERVWQKLHSICQRVDAGRDPSSITHPKIQTAQFVWLVGNSLP